MEESKYSTDRRLAEIEIHARKKGEIKENQISCGKWKKIVERISLSLFILVIWGLLLIPVIFYHLPVPQDQEEQDSLELLNDTIRGQSRFPCRENFFREQRFNICVPKCPSWRQDPAVISTMIDVVMFLAHFIGFVAAIAVLTLSVIRHNSMLVFPNTLIVYMSIVYFVQYFFFVTTFFDRAKLYCTSENWLEAFSNITPFCVVSGMVEVYSALSVSLWWFMLVATLFWKVQFPFHSQSFQKTNKMKFLHIGCGLAGLFIPLIPVIALMSGHAVKIKSSGGNFISSGLGFTSVRFPPQPCNGNNHVIVYYSLVLPTNILLAIGITLIILVFRIIHEEFGLFKKKKRTSNIFKFGSSERKVLLILFYYIISTVINITAYASISRSDLFIKRLTKYFTCEMMGHDPSNPCNRDPIETTFSSTLLLLSYGFHGLLPLVNLIFVVNIDDLKIKCFYCFKLLKTSS